MIEQIGQIIGQALTQVDSIRDLWALLRHFRYTLGQIYMLASTIWWLMGLIVTIVSFMVAYYIYQKAGKKPWACFIPYYDDFVLCDIAMGKGWMLFMLYIPFVRFVFRIILSLHLAWSFGKGTWFGIGMFFFPLLFKAILALSDKITYRGPAN